MISTQSLKHILDYFKKISLFTAILLMLINTAEASYTKLAKNAGVSHQTMEKIVKKIVKVESTTGDYHAHNKKSGAYGRYQIIPSTAKAYAKKLHIPYSQWKKPHNQDKIFQAILNDNIRALKRNGIKISAFSIYGAHQQGAGGFKSIVKNKRLTKQLERNLRRNLPGKLRRVHRSKLKRTWMAYWKKKFS
jgi:predicted transcriptional regulator